MFDDAAEFLPNGSANTRITNGPMNSTSLTYPNYALIPGLRGGRRNKSRRKKSRHHMRKTYRGGGCGCNKQMSGGYIFNKSKSRRLHGGGGNTISTSTNAYSLDALSGTEYGALSAPIPIKGYNACTPTSA